MATRAPLVGRHIEVEILRGALEAEARSAFVLAGSPGVGKSRLAAEIAGMAEAMDYQVVRVTATSAGAAIPFGPLAQLVPDGDTSSADRLELLRAVERAIVAKAGDSGRLLVCVDDAHLLDDSSAVLVHQLVEARSCMLVTTLRAGVPAPDPVVRLWKEGLAERFDLEPLDETQVGELTAVLLGGPVEGTSAHQLWSITKGNPLFLTELLRDARETQSVVRSEGVWIFKPESPPPGRLMELVGTLMADLPEGCGDVLDLLALCGSIGLVSLETLVSPEAVDEAERRGLVEVFDDGLRIPVQLGHPLFGEVRRRRLSRSKERRLWGQLAQWLAETGARRREDDLKIALWQLNAGVPGDPDVLTRAARRARTMHDMELAVRLGRASLAAGGGVDAGLALAEGLFARGAHEEADVVMAGQVERCNNDAERVMLAAARSYNLSVLMGRSTDALSVLEEAIRHVNDPVGTLRLRGSMATISLFSGDVQRVIEATADGCVCEDPAVRKRSFYLAGCAFGLMGQLDRAIDASVGGLEADRLMTDATRSAEVHLVGAILGRLGAGESKLAEADAVSGYRSAVESNDMEGTATFAFLHGLVLVQTGQLAAAESRFREGAGINQVLKDQTALRWCHGGRALALGLASDAANSARAVQDLDQTQRGWVELFETEVIDRGRAWAKVSAGELSEAIQLLSAAAARASAHSQAVPESVLLHDIARLGAPRRVRHRLTELAGIVEGSFVSTMATHAAALKSKVPSALEEVAREFESTGADQLACEAAATVARLYRSEGLRRKAIACAQLAEELAGRCGLTPSLGEDLHGGVTLSPREREVAAMVSAGLTSKEVAARLYLSVRTVNNHLQRVYTKLGINDREELSRAIAAQPP